MRSSTRNKKYSVERLSVPSATEIPLCMQFIRPDPISLIEHMAQHPSNNDNDNNFKDQNEEEDYIDVVLSTRLGQDQSKYSLGDNDDSKDVPLSPGKTKHDTSSFLKDDISSDNLMNLLFNAAFTTNNDYNETLLKAVFSSLSSSGELQNRLLSSEEVLASKIINGHNNDDSRRILLPIFRVFHKILQLIVTKDDAKYTLLQFFPKVLLNVCMNNGYDAAINLKQEMIHKDCKEKIKEISNLLVLKLGFTLRDIKIPSLHREPYSPASDADEIMSELYVSIAEQCHGSEFQTQSL